MTGRWPTNVVLSPAMAEVLDGQSGNRPGFSSGGTRKRKGDGIGFDTLHANGEHSARYDDSGGASRFFVQAGYEQWELEWILANGLRPCGE